MTSAASATQDDLTSHVVQNAAETASLLRKARQSIADVIFGQSSVIERTLITVLCGGHGLLVGVPGLAKTKLVDTMGTVLGLPGFS